VRTIFSHVHNFTVDLFCSSFEAMKAETERNDELVAVKERIQQLKTEYINDLELLYDIHANDYLNEVMDLYASKPELLPEDMDGIKVLVRYLVEDSLQCSS